MEQLRKIVKEEISKLTTESHYSDNYGLPEWFNLLDEYQKENRARKQAEHAVKMIEEVLGNDNISLIEKPYHISNLIKKHNRSD